MGVGAVDSIAHAKPSEPPTFVEALVHLQLSMIARW